MSVHDNNIIGNELSDSEDDMMQERLRQLARQRDERRLNHITQINKIAEEQETQDQHTAQARVDIKKKKEAADLEDVSFSFSFCNRNELMVVIIDGCNRNDAKLLLRLSTIRGFWRKSKLERGHR